MELHQGEELVLSRPQAVPGKGLPGEASEMSVGPCSDLQRRPRAARLLPRSGRRAGGGREAATFRGSLRFWLLFVFVFFLLSSKVSQGSLSQVWP